MKGHLGADVNLTLLQVLVMDQPVCVAHRFVCAPGLCCDKST